MSNNVLSADYVVELAAYCFKNKKILSICHRHLKYSYLFDEAQKKVFRFLFQHFEVTDSIPTVGVVGQNHSGDKDVINFLSKTKKYPCNAEEIPSLLQTFEKFIKDSRFRIMYEKIGDLYNQGKQEEGYRVLQEEADAINNFSLKENYYTTVFDGFQERNGKREQDMDISLLEKCSFGIPELDEATFGGFNKGTTALFMARSGAGKSTFLRWVGLTNARMGKRVVHFQAEGSEQECLEAYDAGWTGINTRLIEVGTIPRDRRDSIERARKSILSQGGEIYVYASETFDSMSIELAREKLLEIEKDTGKVDLVIFDYLECFTVNGFYGGESGVRRQREAIANKMTNLAIETKTAIITATQSMDISPEQLNNEDFVITRHHVSEFKNVIKPFSYFITHNQTEDEEKIEMVRLYCDKFRKYRSGQIIRIYQSLSTGRYCNVKKTLEELHRKS